MSADGVTCDHLESRSRRVGLIGSLLPAEACLMRRCRTQISRTTAVHRVCGLRAVRVHDRHKRVYSVHQLMNVAG